MGPGAEVGSFADFLHRLNEMQKPMKGAETQLNSNVAKVRRQLNTIRSLDPDD